MTRINVIPVKELSDKHLLAEYRELPRVFRLARNWHNRKQQGRKYKAIPNEYTMGRGHVTFFYDKLLFCLNRQSQLYRECLSRGFNVQHNPEDAHKDFLDAPAPLFNNYKPTRKAMSINRDRIETRLAEAEERHTSR